MAYACPQCKRPMKKQPHWAILHCLECNKSIDLWYDPEPEKIDGNGEEEWDYYKHAIVIPVKKSWWAKIKEWMGQ